MVRASLFLAIAVLSAFLVAGCGSGDPPANVGEVTTSPQGEAQMKAGKPMRGGAVPNINE